jgi:hypothetical protein
MTRCFLDAVCGRKILMRIAIREACRISASETVLDFQMRCCIFATLKDTKRNAQFQLMFVNDVESRNPHFGYHCFSSTTKRLNFSIIYFSIPVFVFPQTPSFLPFDPQCQIVLQISFVRNLILRVTKVRWLYL